MEKQCFKCLQTRPIGDFYKHKYMSDGYLGKCKACTKDDVKRREATLRADPDYVEKERKRGRTKYYRLNYVNKKQVYAHKKATMQRYNSKYPEKEKARSAYKELKCNVGFHWHHWSYNDQHLKDVIELSTRDHYKLHRYIKYDQSFKMYRTLDGFLLDTKEKHINYFNSIKHLE